MNPKRKQRFSKVKNFSKKPISAKMPEPTLMHLNDNFSPLRNNPILKESIFASSMTSKPVVPVEYINCNLSRYMSLIDETFSKICKDDVKVTKLVSIELYRYYCVSLLWARIINLKMATKQRTAATEDRYLLNLTEKQFRIPGPILGFLKTMGTAVDMGDKEFVVTYPDLPSITIGQIKGFHAVNINEQNYNLFEEIPSLGMVAEGICRTLEQNPPLEYRPLPMANLDHRLTPNQNFLGYAIPSRIKNKVFNTIIGFGVTPN